MKRLALIAAAVAALAAAVVAGTATAGDPAVTLVQVKGPPFPVRTYSLSLANGAPLTVHDVKVTENGNPVVAPSLIPASKAAPKTFGVVLVLDTSYSMTGKPIAAALAAEQAFVAKRNPHEQIALTDFNHKTTQVLPLTTSSDDITKALSTTPTLSGGTHIYDAVHQAESILKRGNINSGSIVVLSDGNDTGSTLTADQVGKSATATNMQIYTIGLKDAQYNSHALKALANAGGGQYAEAKPGQLAPLFDELSRTLSNQYLLQYKSPVGPNKQVQVEVKVRNVGTATTGYTSPPLQVTNTTQAPYKQSIGNRIWDSWVTMIVVALLAAGVIALLTIGLLQPKRSGLPARMAEFVSIRGLQKDKGPTTTTVEEEDAEPDTIWGRFQATLEIANIDIEPEWIVAGTFAGTALTFLLIYVWTGSPWWALFALAIPYFVREWIVRTLAHRRNRFAEQLPDALQVIASALRSGHSFAGALAVVVESASEPMKSEMQRVVADEQLGVPMQQSLLVVAERMASSDVEQLALVSELQREAGGNAAEVVDRVAETVRERFDLRRLVQTLTMQGRMSRWIVTALPIGIILILQIENPHYLHPLLQSTGGKVVFGLAAVWAVAGSYAIKKIVEIEV